MKWLNSHFEVVTNQPDTEKVKSYLLNVFI